MSPAATSSRWCPTPEQLMILEEMYRSGVRTPSATQIQQITSHLSFYGKIEGKNVFYWFQNHKARDRQKLRRKLTKQLELQHQLYRQQKQYPNFLHYFAPDPTASPAFQHFPCYNSVPNPFPQVGGIQEVAAAAAAKQVMNYTWKFDVPDSVEMEKAMMKMYGSDWLIMVAMGPPLSSATSPCYSRPPLKTLELFPVKASNLKEECINNNNNSPNASNCKPLSCNNPITTPAKPQTLP